MSVNWRVVSGNDIGCVRCTVDSCIDSNRRQLGHDDDENAIFGTIAIGQVDSNHLVSLDVGTSGSHAM